MMDVGAGFGTVIITVGAAGFIDKSPSSSAVRRRVLLTEF